MAKRPTDARNTWAWRRLRDQVVLEEPWCWLKLPCCTGRSETGDHVIPAVERPDLILVRSNVRGACHACNRKRRDKPIGQLAGWHAQAQSAWVL